MSRLLSEKRIIAVDTSDGTAGAGSFDNGAVVVDTVSEKVWVSDGASWTEVVLGSNLSVATNISLVEEGDTTVAGSLAAKTYIDAQIIAANGYTDTEISDIVIPTITPTIYAGYPAATIGESEAHEMGMISGDAGLESNKIMGKSLVCEVYNYSNTTRTITDIDGNGILDVADNRTQATIDILGGQKITFINNRGSLVAAFRSSI